MSARLRRVGAVVLRQLYLMRGSPARVIPLFAWVCVDMALWGFLTRYLGTLAPAGRFAATLLGCVLLWDYFTRVMQGVTMAFFEDVWARNLLNFFASPLSVGDYLAGLLVTSAMTSGVGLIAMVAMASAGFGWTPGAAGVALGPGLAVLFAFGIALGVVAAAMVLRLGPAAEWFVWPIPAMIAPFSGVFYPVAILPAWMRAVARALPPSYVFEVLRARATASAPPAGGLALGAALAAVDLALAAAYFLASHRAVVRDGRLARSAAETAG